MEPVASTPLPRRYRVDRGGSELRVSWRWLGARSIVVGLAAIVWDFYALQMWSAPNDWVHSDPPVPFCLAMSLMAVAITYIAVALLVNSSHLVVDRTRLAVEHGPLPWPPPPEIDVMELDQLFVKCSRSDMEEGGLMTFTVHALMRGGEDKRLFDDFARREQAEYLEHEIEDLLRIRDRAISVKRR